MNQLPPAVVAQLNTWFANVTQKFGVNGETGVDIGIPMGTPVYSLTSGRVLGTGYYGGGGVASVASTINYAGMGNASIYYQHLDMVTVTPNQQVQPGDLIGYSGGQLSGGHHPSTPQFSSGPHIEVGINAPYGGMWSPLGANVNPLPWLQSLLTSGYVPWTGGGNIFSTAGSLAGGTMSTDTSYDSNLGAILDFANRHVNHTKNTDFWSLCLALNDAETFPPVSSITAPPNNWSTNIPIIGGPIGHVEGVVDAPSRIMGFIFASVEAAAIRGACLSIGMVIVLIVVVKLVSEHGDKAQEKMQQVAPTIMPVATEAAAV